MRGCNRQGLFPFSTVPAAQTPPAQSGSRMSLSCSSIQYMHTPGGFWSLPVTINAEAERFVERRPNCLVVEEVVEASDFTEESPHIAA